MIRLSQIQNWAVSQLSADSTIASLCAPIVYALRGDDEAQRTAIADQLRATGVCIEIGVPIARKADPTIGGRVAKLIATFDVWIGEKVTGTHTPSDAALVEKVAAVLLSVNTPTVQNIDCSGYEAAVSEHGYVLHILSFECPVIFGR